MKVAIVTLLLLVAPGLAGAQEPGPPPPPPPYGPRAIRRPDAVRAQVQERLRTMRMWRLTALLNLDEATAQRLFPLLHRYDEQLSPLQRQQGDIMVRMRAELQTTRPDPAKLNQAIDELLRLRAQIGAIEAERTREVRKILTPVQQARLVLALPRIERELRGRVRRAMNLPEEDD
jgi:Spy/CpxP family protein refolding chaperone